MKIFKKLGIVLALLLLVAGNADAAVKVSKACADKMAGGRAVANVVLQGTTFQYIDGGAGNDQIGDSGNGLAVFHVGDMITVDGSTSNDGTYEILAVAAGTVDVGTGLLTTEAAGDQTALASGRGHSLLDIFKFGVIRIYSGTQPTAPEETEAGGTLLLEITVASGAWEDDVDTNGLLFDEVVDGVVAKSLSQVWSGAGIATGTAAWGRLSDNADGDTLGADATEVLPRIDFSVGTSGDLVMSPSVTIGVTKTIDEFTLTVPLL